MLDHPGYQWFAGQELKRFVWDTGRAKPGRDDTEDAHFRT